MNPIGHSRPDLVKLSFVHVNDTHGIVEPLFDPQISDTSEVGGLAQMNAVIAQEKAKNPEGTLVVHAGDHAEGSMISYLSEGRVIHDATRGVFDAQIPGNHDHAWGQGAMHALLDDLGSPTLCANVTGPDGQPIEGFQPYHIFERNGVKIGVLGLNTPEVPHYVAEEKLEGLTFHDPIKTTLDYLPKLKEAGVEVFVVASHLGFVQPEDDMASDVKLAEAAAARRQADPDFPKLDLIIGAHTHHKLDHGHKVGDTLIVQAEALTKHVGVAELTYDPARRQVVAAEARLIPVIADEVEPDPGTQAILAPYLAQAKEQGARVMGQAVEPLQHAHREAAKLNQIHADSLLEGTDAEIVVCNSRTLRADVPAGDVTYAQLYSALPFTEDGAVTLTATGAMVRRQIEEGITDRARELAVPAGLKYSYDPARPEGERVVSLTLADGTPLEDDREYRVGMNWTMSRNPVWDQARDRRTVDSCQDLFFEKFSQDGPWKNDADDRVVRLS